MIPLGRVLGDFTLNVLYENLTNIFQVVECSQHYVVVAVVKWYTLLLNTFMLSLWH